MYYSDRTVPYTCPQVKLLRSKVRLNDCYTEDMSSSSRKDTAGKRGGSYTSLNLQIPKGGRGDSKSYSKSFVEDLSSLKMY